MTTSIQKKWHQTREVARKEILKNSGTIVGPDNPKAQIAVLDNFVATDDFGVSHGDKVARVFTLGGVAPDQVRLVQAKPNTHATFDILKSNEGSASRRLQAFVQGTALDFLESTHAEVERQALAGAVVINHSQTLSPAKTAKYLFEQALDYGDAGMNRSLTEMGNFLCEALDLPKQADWDNECALNQKLNDLTNEIYREDSSVLAAQDAFNSRLQQLKEEGVVYITPSGNDGRLLKTLERTGIQVASSMVHGLNSVSQAVVVGAFDHRGTSDPSDDTLAAFSVPHPQTDFLAAGVGVDLGLGFLEDGTSFAAPQVGLRYHELRQTNPKKTPDELLLELADSSPGRIQGSHLAIVR